jgi:putative membrane-bound dehydrogenase-like protein
MKRPLPEARLLAVLLSCSSAIAAESWTPPEPPPEMPLDSFVIPDGLEIIPWAASPLFFNPTNIDIDHRGRIWVAEAVNYRRMAERRPAGDRIVILEDTNGDGTADKSTVFWQDPELLAPLGLAVFDNVVIISQPPHLLKLTDVNRDSVFNPADGDTREVLLTGFNGRNHDHSLHSLTGGPDGKWYFNLGNNGGMFTDRSNKIIRLGSAYVHEPFSKYIVDVLKIADQPSDDGFIYNPGATIRMNPDATAAEVVGHGYRNSYEQSITSRGDVFQSDNDDPPACRVTHVLERGNAGFFSRDGKRTWAAERRPGQSTPVAQWRQEDPGVMPAGDVYGGGSPTGVAYYENGALGEKWRGTLLIGEPGRNVIFSYQPKRHGASYALERSDFVTTNPQGDFDGSDFVGGVRKQSNRDKSEISHFLFRPSDVCVGPDGAIYISDWVDPRVGGHNTADASASGVIYRLAPKGFKPGVPEIDLSTLEGAIAALRSPAVNTRWLGFMALKAKGPAAFTAISNLLQDPDPYLALRGIWLLPHLGEDAQAKLDELASSENESIRLTAFRAIRRTDGLIDPLPYARKFSTDPSPALRSEAAQAMRGIPFEKASPILVAVAKQYDGSDRAYLENLGIGTGHQGNDLWKALAAEMKPGDPLDWSDTFARLTWRLMPEAAVSALKQRAASDKLSAAQRKLAVDSIAFIRARPAAEAMLDLAAEDSPIRDDARWWLKNRSTGEWSEFDILPIMRERKLILEPVPPFEVLMPQPSIPPSFTVAQALALQGDATRGKAAAARCIMCHQIDGLGLDYGPDLRGFGRRQPPEVTARALIEPSADIAHGYEGTELLLKNGIRIHGQVLSRGNPLLVRSMGGTTQEIPKKAISSQKPLDHSLMLSADQLGMTAQDVADVIEWMKSY